MTPVEALQALQSINTPDRLTDFDGNGVVTPLEALSVLQRIGYRRAELPVSLTSEDAQSLRASNRHSQQALPGSDREHSTVIAANPGRLTEIDSVFAEQPAEAQQVAGTAGNLALETIFSDVSLADRAWLDAI